MGDGYTKGFCVKQGRREGGYGKATTRPACHISPHKVRGSAGECRTDEPNGD